MSTPLAAPRAYLILRPEAMDAALDQVFAVSGLACVALDTGGGALETVEDAVARLMPPIQARDIAFLLTDAGGLPQILPRVSQLGADGVHLSHPKSHGEVREALGRDRILGVFCGESRHAAMEAAEAGADYVAFVPKPSLIRIWTETMLVPCVAWETDLDQEAEMAAAGAEFIARRI